MDTCKSQDDVSVKLLAAAATDEVLFAAATLGDGPALVELCERYSNTAFKMAYRITGNRDHTEVATQNLRTKANIRSTTFDGKVNCSTWLARIAINSLHMIYRSKRDQRKCHDDYQQGN
jgi:DNA-directed RNA polymerase specialized sigma24 family protein